MKRATGCFFIFVALLVLSVLVAYVAALRVMKSRGVRARLTSELANFFDCNAAISPLRWNGLTISGSTTLSRVEPLPIEIRAARVSSPLNIVDLWRNDWKIDKVTLVNVQAAFGESALRHIDRAGSLTQPSEGNAELRDVDIRRASILFGNTAENAGEFRDVHVKVSRRDRNLVVDGFGGTFQYANWPAAFLLSARLNYAKPNLRIERASMSFGDVSSVEVTGDINFDQPQQPRGAGAVVIMNTILKSSALLQHVVAFTGRTEFAQLKIDHVKADYEWNAQALTVKNFAGEAKQVAAVRGEFVVHDGKLDGEFELGLAPDIVEKFPGAREDIFNRSGDGYVWTAVAVSGRPGQLRDNLRPRLLRAAQDHHADAKTIEAIEEL